QIRARVAAGQKPYLARRAVIPPFCLFAASVRAIVKVLGPLPLGDVAFRPRARRSAVMKFPDRAGAAVGTVGLEGHGGDVRFWILDFGFFKGGCAAGRWSRTLEKREVLVDFPGGDLAVVGFPFAGFQLDELVGDHSQARADDAVAFELIEG